MEVFHISAALAALGYSVAATLSKRALAEGAGTLRIAFLVNWVFVLVFACLLFGYEGTVPWAQIGYPLMTGALFFLGQVFTFAAIRVGNVSLQTPVMGTKAVFAVLIAVLLGTETITVSMALAAVVSMVGVALLGFSGDGVERVGRTLTLALLSSFFFAGSDTMVGYYASDFGVPMFLFIAIVCNAILSFGLMPFFNGSFGEIPSRAWPWILGACVAMGGQALILNFSLAQYQQVAVTNVIYSTRGLWSVFFAVLAARLLGAGRAAVATRRIFVLRMLGAALMCLSIFVLFYPN